MVDDVRISGRREMKNLTAFALLLAALAPASLPAQDSTTPAAKPAAKSATKPAAQSTAKKPAAKAGTKPAAKTATVHKATTAAPATVVTPSGLKYVDLIVGTGPSPKDGDTVVVNYTGRFTSGKVFDTSIGKAPFEFVLGRGNVIKGWDEGVASMKVGGKRKLTILPALAYGEKGYPGVIPPHSTLVFEVRLLKIK